MFTTEYRETMVNKQESSNFDRRKIEQYFIRFSEHSVRRVGAAVLVSLLVVISLNGQSIIRYAPDALTASIHYNEFLHGIYKSTYSQLPNYPAKGCYSPTHYSVPGIKTGSGACNYVVISTNGLLAPGHQYRITLTVKFGKAYAGMPYFQEHFGVALSSDLYENHFGLWAKDFEPLGISMVEEPVTTSFVFRPLCASKYMVIGVFQGQKMEKQECFACPYGFEVYDVLVDVYEDPHAAFSYLCDAFEEDRLDKKFSTGYDTDTVYFDSGSAAVQPAYVSVLDSIPSKLRTKQDLITLYAYTDNSGSANDSLGAARNASIREALMNRGIDTSRILNVNYGETKASRQIKQDDRRVEIDVNRGKLYQKYYTEALQAATTGDYILAKAKMMKWSKMVPPDNAIYALFDCWGDGEHATVFRRDLLNAVRTRNYPKGKELIFKFDSLYCEDQRGRTLMMRLRANHLPGFPVNCDREDFQHFVNHHATIDSVYNLYGFPSVVDVGVRGNKVLPYMIIHSNDTLLQKRYLPIVQKACEEERISWEFYAMLYDKISVARSGKQRYGTQWAIDEKGVLGGMIPFEDEEKVHEYRKQVGLVPLSDF